MNTAATDPTTDLILALRAAAESNTDDAYLIPRSRTVNYQLGYQILDDNSRGRGQNAVRAAADALKLSQRIGWCRWCMLHEIDDCENEAERQGWRAAADANDRGGNRPTISEAAELELTVYPDHATEVPSTLDGWQSAIRRMLEGTTPEPARSAALDNYADAIRQTCWRRHLIPRARALESEARAGIDADADLLDGFFDLVAAGCVSFCRARRSHEHADIEHAARPTDPHGC